MYRKLAFDMLNMTLFAINYDSVEKDFVYFSFRCGMNSCIILHTYSSLSKGDKYSIKDGHNHRTLEINHIKLY